MILKKEFKRAGEWIMIRNDQSVEHPVPPLSIWYATPKREEKRRDVCASYWSDPDAHSKHALEKLQYAEIITLDGTLTLTPDEYLVIDIEKYLNEIGEDSYKIEFMTTGHQKAFKERLFYMQQRGLSKVDAIKLMHGELKSRQLFYLIANPGLLEYFGFDWMKYEKKYYQDLSYFAVE